MTRRNSSAKKATDGELVIACLGVAPRELVFRAWIGGHARADTRLRPNVAETLYRIGECLAASGNK